MEKEYTAEEILKIIENCENNRKKSKEAFKLIKNAKISKKEFEKLQNDEDYNVFCIKCYRTFGYGEL